MLSIRSLGQVSLVRAAEVGAAFFHLLPYYGTCGLAVLSANARRRRGHARGRFREVNLRIERTAGRADHRPVAG